MTTQETPALLDTEPGEFRTLSADVTAQRQAYSGLEHHLVDLDMLGYTIVENALDAGHVAELTTALIELAGADEARQGTREQGTREIVLLLSRGGPAFERLLLKPVPLLLVTYLLGRSRVLSSMTGYLKAPGAGALGVHSDTAYVPDPLPQYGHLANVNYCLTDYTTAGGCLTMVPGSHRYSHRPHDGAAVAEAVPIEVPAGSAIVFTGNTWHGALPRAEEGHRLTISTLFARMYMRVQEDYRRVLDDAVYDRNPAIFGELVGRTVPLGWSTPEEADQIMSLRRDRAPLYYRTRSARQ